MQNNVMKSILLNLRFIRILIFIGFISISVNSQVQTRLTDLETMPGVNPPFIKDDFTLPVPAFNSFTKKPGHYSRLDWQQRIDSTWGPGLPTATKLEIFDKYWREIDSAFACLHNHPLNWDSLRSIYRPQIEAGVSRGRFCAILNHLTLLLRESHSYVTDDGVTGTNLVRGTPIFVISGISDTRFAAGITPLPDSSLLVYSVIPSHPLGLQRGDRILGYDGIPWKVLYKQLLEWQLPIGRLNSIGSSPSSYTHSLLRSAGRNWYLFDTIDIVKYSSGDTVHLPTTLMDASGVVVRCTEQMNIAGVPKPNYPSQLCSYGIVSGTNIGYIYVWAWTGTAELEFLTAVQNLMQTDGLIIDFRYNLGGNMFLSNSGLSLLFDSSVSTIDFGVRCSPNHQQMCQVNNPNPFIIPGSPPGYNKPIAVLTGPGAVSSGDQVALRFKYHKHARFFGKSTSAAFNNPITSSLYNGFYFRYAQADAYQLSNPNVYLTHEEFPVDEEVWLTPDMVAQGRDDVVEAAINWIIINGISKIGSEVPQMFSLAQNYPNPFNPSTKINFALPNSSFATLIVYDILGREITTLVNEQLKPGKYSVDWDAANYASGVYYYRLHTEGYSETKKMILVK